MKMSMFLLAGAALAVSCKQEFEYKFAEKGPDLTVSSFSESAYMGGSLSFSVDINDDDFDLSTLKAKLYFDQDMVSDTTIRTKTDGTYEGVLEVPFLANIPNGTASLVFEAQNVGQAITADTVAVAVSRPEFEYLTLVTSDGQQYRMESTGTAYEYAVEGSFPAQCNAVIESPAVPGTENVLHFGWSSGAVALDGESEIPFSYSASGYTITFNTLTFEASPFVTIEIAGTVASMTDDGNYEAVVNLTQDGEFQVSGYSENFSDWTIDPDFIEMTSESGTFRFLPVDGMYKITMDMANKFFKFEAMKSSTELATLNEDGTGAVWLIGSTCVGKPTISQGASWNPENGGLCLAQIEPGVHQITLVAGVQLTTSDIDFKFFHQKTWGGEFGGGTITTDSPLITIGESDGNIHLADGVTLEAGGVYRFTVDLTNATVDNSGDNMVMSGAVLSVVKDGEQEIPAQEIAINGQTLEMVTADHYTATMDLTQNSTLSVTGLEMSDMLSYYLDPDYLSLGSSALSFAATDGRYRIDLYTDSKYVSFTKVNEDGSDATLADGALWLMGWGVANPVMTSQFGWDQGSNFCMAEVSPMVFQFTGTAVGETDGTTMGGRFRYDYVSCKYFFYNGYNHGELNADQVEFSGNAAELLTMSGSNIEASSLEEGATYRLTIDLSDGTLDGETFTGTEKVIFEKL